MVELTFNPFVAGAAARFALFFARPAKRRHRVSARQRVTEFFQRLLEARLLLFQARTTRTHPADSAGHFDTPLKFLTPLADSFSRETRCCGHQCISFVPNRLRFGCRPKAPRALIEQWRNGRVLRDRNGFQSVLPIHRSRRSHSLKSGGIIYARDLRAVRPPSLKSRSSGWCCLAR